ncbi:50S ribosomal protein L11 methyltransferase [Sulfurimonas sp. MAG313]|nr:50S ribosomal protein L11 methyltransferase [Sulfurimonas sp. MAG313]MDF1881858.1 50S ribosomal protein L11 methyltransferase [Sulfurimonas sp. MAG313]
MQETYFELVVTPTGHLEHFSDFLSSSVDIGFEETGTGFIVRNEDELDTLAWGIEQFALALSEALDEKISVQTKLSQKKNEDWIAKYQEGIEPIAVGKFYIHPTWSEPSSDLINIKIDPALAFGTGHHPTTASCLKAVSTHVTKGMEVVDVGCGSGILALAATKIGAIVDLCDTDIISVDNAKENFKLNEASYKEIWEGSITLSTKKYDLVIANIVADVLIFIASDLKKATKNKLILSGILDKYEEKVQKKFSDMTCVERIVDGEWISLVMEK